MRRFYATPNQLARKETSQEVVSLSSIDLEDADPSSPVLFLLQQNNHLPSSPTEFCYSLRASSSFDYCDNYEQHRLSPLLTSATPQLISSSSRRAAVVVIESSTSATNENVPPTPAVHGDNKI